MLYQAIMFDLDHTLLDSDESERLAFASTMDHVGVADPAAIFETYTSINQTLWRQVELGAMRPQEVRVERFRQLLDAAGIGGDPAAVADVYALALGEFGELYDGALAMLGALVQRAPLALVTNGLSDVQRRRIERLGLDDLFSTIVISAEVGCSKPAASFFDIACRELGEPRREATLMVGDSLTADIRGAADYGLATCWYDRHRRGRPELAPRIDHHLCDLSDLCSMLEI